MALSQPVSFDARLNQYEEQAESLAEAHKLGGYPLLQQIQEQQLSFRNWPSSDVQPTLFTLVEAQRIIAHIYGFENWEKLTNYVNEVTRNRSTVWQFEAAIEAIIAGDTATLGSLLLANPGLVRLRSMRVHQATLLHYVGANGIENYRQQSPQNAVEIAEILLKAGAEVDALANMYGKDTTLGLVATSIHPLRAGVQIPLIETLLKYDAAVNGPPQGWPILMAALANGCHEAAETLANHGAKVDSIVAAAGLGQLDLVRNFFREDGSIKINEPVSQPDSAFFYACTYGHIDVAAFLLEKGVDLSVYDDAGQTGLHCAVLGGQLNMVRWLLQQNAPLEFRNVYGGTVLGQAFWCASNGNPDKEYVPIIETLLDAGATIEPGALIWLEQQQNLSPTTKEHITAILRQHGAKS